LFNRLGLTPMPVVNMPNEGGQTVHADILESADGSVREKTISCAVV